MHAGFSACAQAELNPIGVCMTTYTVGSLPCTSAAALARTEGLPVVFISGAPGENEVNNEALHHTVHPHTAWRSDLDAALNAFRALGVRTERLQGQRHGGQPNMPPWEPAYPTPGPQQINYQILAAATQSYY